MLGFYTDRARPPSRGELDVRISGNDDDWNPSQSNYADYREYVYGAGWKVWVKLPGNPEFQQAPLQGVLPVPTYQDAADIDVPDSWLQ